MSAPRGTFSIVASDLEAGEVGCAVQSKYFSVGSVVPWVRAGVGAVATQAAGVAAYGAQALAELETGSAPEEAIRRVLAADDGRERRQLGVVTALGDAASFTGAECLAWAGHRTGPGYAVQGNILAGEDVVLAMEHAFEETVGPLAHRLVAALEAGQAAGGDSRGQQSAAVIVERAGAASSTTEGIDRVCDLRVEDHAAPISEIRRLVGIWSGWDAMRRANVLYARGAYAEAADAVGGAAETSGADPVLFYNLACYESLAGRRDAAIAHLRRAIDADASYRGLAAGDADFDAIRADVAAL